MLRPRGRSGPKMLGMGSGLWGTWAFCDVALPLATKPHMSRCQAPSPAPIPRPGSQTLLNWRDPGRASRGRGLKWGSRGTPPPGTHPTPTHFRGSSDPEMNELSGPGSLDGVRGRREGAGAGSAGSSQQGPEVEGYGAERGAGRGLRGPGREVRGFRDY